MAIEKIFVSPAVVTTERELTFFSRQIGVTTLGICGEFTKGPAFQPVFITNYDEHVEFFGGTDPEKFLATNYPKYEGSYIAKSYLSQSNQLFVTRILGLSGYDAGPAWVIRALGGPDPASTGNAFTLGGGEEVLTIEYNIVNQATNVLYNGADVNLAPFITRLAANYSNQDKPSVNDFINSIIQVGINIPTNGNDFTLGDIAFGSEDEINYFDGVNATQFNTFYFNGAPGLINSEFVSVDPNVLTITVTTANSGAATFEYADNVAADAAVEDMVLAVIRSRGDYDALENRNLYVNQVSNPGASDIVEGITSDFTLEVSTNANAIDLDGSTYTVSFDERKSNNIEKVFGRRVSDIQKGPLFIEEYYPSTIRRLIEEGRIRGINLENIELPVSDINNYVEPFRAAETPWFLSQVKGSKVQRLFKAVTISDGDNSNEQIKISIQNVRFDSMIFDLVIRRFNDFDSNPQAVEVYTKCSMDKKSKDYVAAKIGTLDGEYPSISKYISLIMAEGDLSGNIPAGFEGFRQRPYDNGVNTLKATTVAYKTQYAVTEKKRRFYLGLSDTVGIDKDLFRYRGLDDNGNAWTQESEGFHMDVNAAGKNIEFFTVSPVDGSLTLNTKPYSVITGVAPFDTEQNVLGTDYEVLAARTFTTAPYGGFDGWDVYRRQRTNTDLYRFNSPKAVNGLFSGAFTARPTSEGEPGLTSDYYAYLEGYNTFKNTEEVAINIFSTPGIDLFNQPALIDDVIEIVERDRSDCIHIATLPDTNTDGELLYPEDVATALAEDFDSSYVATYYPWIQLRDSENNVLTWLPPTAEVVKSMAYTDNVRFPWFANAGVNRGLTNAVQARFKLNQEQRDIVYENRINPMATFINEGVVIFGNKTLKVEESPLDRINVRRLLLRARKLISTVSTRLLFEQNDQVVRAQFLALVNPILDNIRKERGLSDFRVMVDDSQELLDKNQLSAKIAIRPINALEFITIEFIVTDSGAFFDDI